MIAETEKELVLMLNISEVPSTMGLQNHLDEFATVNLGAYYTPQKYVDVVWKMINNYVDEDTVIFDCACGYGNFLLNKTVGIKKGNDIDLLAYNTATSLVKDAKFYNFNALVDVNREKYEIEKSQKLIIIGNPPYNDTTSLVKKNIKHLQFEVDEDLKARDVGISFLLMFNKLKANYICVLHPLSYLIKKANFNLLKEFKENYTLIDDLIISSAEFYKTSKTNPFPIIIALYERTEKGMSYEYILNYTFKTIEDKTFRLADFEYIGNFIQKYPQRKTPNQDDILFWTLRDVNALRRNKTFVKKHSNNTVIVDKSKIDYYIYVDVFKDFINHVPYYFGNLDIPINDKLFQQYKPYFLSYFIEKNPDFKKHVIAEIIPNAYDKVVEYFRFLLKEHLAK